MCLTTTTLYSCDHLLDFEKIICKDHEFAYQSCLRASESESVRMSYLCPKCERTEAKRARGIVENIYFFKRQQPDKR